MLRPIFAAALAASLAGLAGSASAQVQTLPQEGRAESRAGGINSSLSNQAVNRGAAQQNQFEINSLRAQPPAPQVQPPPAAVLPPR